MKRVDLTPAEIQAGIDALEFGFGMAGGFHEPQFQPHRNLLAKLWGLREANSQPEPESEFSVRLGAERGEGK